MFRDFKRGRHGTSAFGKIKHQRSYVLCPFFSFDFTGGVKSWIVAANLLKKRHRPRLHPWPLRNTQQILLAQ